MASNCCARSYLLAIFVLLSQIMLSKCGPVPNGTNPRNAEGQLNAAQATPTKPRVLHKIKDKEGITYKLKNDERCKEDIEDLCAKESQAGGNYDLLLCLQNQIKDDELSDECHQAIWEYKSKLIENPVFETPAIEICKDDWQQIDECKVLQPKHGELVPCLVENKNAIKNARCKHVINKLAQILFSDYRLLKNFYKDCAADVKKFKCGRQDAEEEGDLHTQGSTLECLEDNEGNLTDSCRHKVLRVAELQSKDYHMNRALYFACRNDRERFCANVEAGNGRVYACLMKKKFHAEMSNECRQKLATKQKVESKDYKANFPLLQSCEKEIQRHSCQPKGGSPAALAHVLLCLEDAINNGATVSGSCQQHMKELQEELMEDYSINPAIVAKCDTEIRTYCGKVEKGGKTLDCLMEKAMEKEGKDNKIEFSDKCYDAISNLLKETGAGGDFKVDATLRTQCQSAANKLCRDVKNDMGVLSCLMENIEHKDLGGSCRESLLHLQFFLARDFQLDESLYRACKDDAKNLCENEEIGHPDKDTAPQGMTLACLYRHILPNMNPDPSKKVSKQCVAEVMRTMHQRATDVRLMPHIQHSCISDLSKYCGEKIEAGEEIKCLQDNYDQLQSKCQKSIGEFTEEESEDIDLDKVMVKHCSEMVKEFCSDLLKKNDVDGILPCLYNNKYDHRMDKKCRAELDHRELIELKDYQFSSKFKKACRKDVQTHCINSKSKPDVIACLSGEVRKAVIGDADHKISQECREQLTIEKLRQAEDIQFDPKLYGACAEDVKKHCAHVHKDGPAAVLECLKQAEGDLSDGCSRKIFEREKEEVANANLDVRLFKICKRMIKKYCENVNPNKVLNCLKKHKREMAAEDEQECRDLVFTRQKNALKDIALMPGLEKACRRDISKFCEHVTNNDQVIPCLKKNIEDLSGDCEEFVVDLEKEAALDYRLNPILAKACGQEIDKYCHEIDPGHGEVMECLKEHYKKIENEKCRAEIKEALIEERTDIMADPVLHEACASSVSKHCDSVNHGRGRILQCLMHALESGKKLSKECRGVLKSRKEMWTGFGVAHPESLTDLASVLSNSPRKNYFFIVFSCALAIIFIGGLISGRLTKRITREAKNR
ncbi:Golgi apparatus protein 1-like [Dendronephthya gigantea]|uniref:Golgi apparatus protein 1-like n=1 Tax=Dendronephthya gigantea TaxID=151771 RepID=UPI00106A0D18|nr:Golgi apparatus protein 1-like [Dendronephthya gigantea]